MYLLLQKYSVPVPPKVVRQKQSRGCILCDVHIQLSAVWVFNHKSITVGSLTVNNFKHFITFIAWWTMVNIYMPKASAALGSALEKVSLGSIDLCELYAASPPATVPQGGDIF